MGGRRPLMFGEFANARIFLRPGHVDMRKAINGLSAMAQELLAQDPFSGHLFAYCGRRRDLIKIVYWDRNGFCLWQKRLEKGRFVWPQTDEAAAEISREELSWLLKGMDFLQYRRQLSYKNVV